MIAGGPELAHEGRLNVIRYVLNAIFFINANPLFSLHSRTTSGDIKLNFGRAERIRYKKTIVPIYGTFLQKCYSKSKLVLFHKYIS